MKPKIIMRAKDFDVAGTSVVEVLLDDGTIVREERVSLPDAGAIFDWWRDHSTRAELIVLYDAAGRLVREWDRSKQKAIRIGS